MTGRITKQTRLADIVAMKPVAADTLDALDIDYCCGGNRTLEKALSDSAHEAVALASELDAIRAPADRDWRSAELSELIDYIVATHHVFVRRELAAIDPLLQRVMHAHFRNYGETLREIHRRFSALEGALELHLMKEEEVLFPRILAGSSEALDPLQEMEDEHDGAGEILHELRELTEGFSPPEGACESFRELYQRLESLSANIHRHVHLENYVLAPRVRGA